MDIQQELRRMPEPDPKAAERVLARFKATRRRPMPNRAWVAPVMALAAAALVWVAFPRDEVREMTLNASGETEALTWSDQVQFEFAGHGAVSGSDRDVTVQWDQGKIAVQVAPNTGTELTIVTDEAIIKVIGTAFTVERDKTGVTVDVTHGRVSVNCLFELQDFDGELDNGSGAETCLPLTAAGLTHRADLLEDQNASVEDRIDVINLGLEIAKDGSTEQGELLARRSGVLITSNDLKGALADAEAYLSGGHTARKVEVQQSAARLALYENCDRAMRHLEPLRETGNAEDAVLLAECLMATDPADARALFTEALAELESENEFQIRAKNGLAGLEGR